MFRRVGVALDLDASGYTRGLDVAERKTSTFAKTTNAAGTQAAGGLGRTTKAAKDLEAQSGRLSNTIGRLGSKLRDFAGKGAIAALVAIGLGLGHAVTLGADLNETLSKVGVTFGASADVVTHKADEMAARFGIVKGQFLDAAAAIGLIGKAAGLTQADAADMGASFAELATDVSSFYNVPVSDALDAIRSGLVGESEPLRRYGVLLNEAAVQSEAVRLGLAKAGDELTDQQKVIARASLITQGFADAHGDLARTADSVSNRMRELRGRVENAMATIGQRALPIVSTLLDQLLDSDSATRRWLETLARDVRPAFDSLVNAGADVVHLLGEVWDTAEPAVRILAQIGGAAVLGAMTALADALEAVAGFLSGHAPLVIGLTAAWVGFKLVAAAPAMWSAITGGLETVALKAMYAGDGVKAMASSFGLAQGAAVGIGIGLMAASSIMANAQRHAQELRAELEQEIRAPGGGSTYSQVGHDLNRLNDQITQLRDQAGADRNGFKRFSVEFFQDLNPLADNTIANAEAASQAVAQMYQERQRMYDNIGANERELVTQSGRTQEAVEQAVRATGADLTGNVEDSADARQQILDYFSHVEDNAAVAGVAVTDFTEQTTDELEAAAKAVEDYQARVESAFRGSYDVVSDLGQGITGLSDDLKSAVLGFDVTGELTENQQKLADNLELNADTISTYYYAQLVGAQTFSGNIAKAIQAGYDPALIARVMQAGPDQAAPLLQALVDNQDASFVQMVNDAEHRMGEISAAMVETARLTHLATTAETDDMVRDLETAMSISATKASMGGTATADAIASALNLGLPEVRRIAGEYGISLTDAVNPVLQGTGRPVISPGWVRRSATGNLFESHQPEIAPAGAWRVWAEPETGGEAYIPLANDERRPRAIGILSEVARRFGMGLEQYATGGITGGTGGILGIIRDVIARLAPVPTWAPFGTPVREAGVASSTYARDQVRAYLDGQADANRAPAGLAMGGPGSLPKDTLIRLAEKAGVSPLAAVTAAAIALAESGGNPRAYNPVPPDNSYGLWQVNMIGGLGPQRRRQFGLDSNDQLFDPWTNARAMAAISGGGRNWGPWSTYTSGAYRRYMAAGGILGGGIPFASYDQGGYLPPGLTLALNGTGAPEPVGAAIGHTTNLNFYGTVTGEAGMRSAVAGMLAEHDREWSRAWRATKGRIR